MADSLVEVLTRAERLPDGVFSPRDLRAWPANDVARLTSIGVLEECGLADEIIYDGCDHECAVPNLGFEKHPDEPDRLICVHRCPGGCGRLIFEPQEFEQSRFSLAGLADAIRDAIGASGEVLEDVPGRIVLVGGASIAGRVGEVFLGYGLARPDAAKVAASASRLVAAEHPAVLSVGVKPGNIWSLGRRPMTAVLAEHVRLGPRELDLDLATIFPASGLVEVKPDAWITVTEAANLLVKDVSGIDLRRARARVSGAATKGRFRTNGKKGFERRIDFDSFSTWRLTQRERDLDACD